MEHRWPKFGYLGGADWASRIAVEIERDDLELRRIRALQKHGPVQLLHHPQVAADVRDPRFSRPGGALGNNTVSFPLLGSPTPILEGTNLATGDNGKLEGLPEDSTIFESIGWSDGSDPAVVYTDAVLQWKSPDLACGAA